MRIKVNDSYGKANLAEWLEAKLEDKLKTWHLIAAVCVFNAVVSAILIWKLF